MNNKIFQQGFCPVCSSHLTEENKSKEHLFPKWLLSDCNLYDQRLTLLNGTSIPYRQILIPFCKKCNNDKFGKKLEERVKNIVNKDVDLSIDEEYYLVIWFIKIYLGLRYMEQRLPYNRTDKKDINILPDDFLDEQDQLMFSLIENFGKKIVFNGGSPWSLFRYKISKAETDLFWFYDSIGHPFISIQIGKKAFVCLLTDSGGQSIVLNEPYSSDKLNEYSSSQFIELTIRHLYKEKLRDYIPRFMIIDNEKVINIYNLTKVVLYKEWNHYDYSELKKDFFSGLPSILQKI